MTTTGRLVDYGSAIRLGFEYLLERHEDVVVLGQGLWSPWYVGNTMTALERQFGKDRMREAIRGAAGGTAEDIAKAVSNACECWRGEREQADDITLVVLKLDSSSHG